MCDHLQRKMRHRGAGCGSARLLLALVSLALLLPWLPGATVAAPRSAAVTIFTAAPPPELTAEAVYVFDATVGTELYALDPDKRKRPASLTKIVTALVVLERVQLDEEVTIDQVDLVGTDQSRVDLLAGDTLTVRDLLAGLLIPSGNDAANALARHVGKGLLAQYPDVGNDPVAAFVADMNRIANDLGLRNTHFANPSGLDESGQLASARDLAIVTARAIANPIFAEIVKTPNLVLPSRLRPEGYVINTTNDLLLEGIVVGVKTGTTEAAGGCLIAASWVGQNLIISVVLGSVTEPAPQGGLQSPARFQDMRAILAALAADYLWLDLAAPETLTGLAEELGVWETTLPPGPALVVPAARRDELRYRLQLGPPGEPNAPVGKVLFFVGSDLLSERPVLQA